MSEKDIGCQRMTEGAREGQRVPERDGVVRWRDGGYRRGMEGAGEDRRVPERD